MPDGRSNLELVRESVRATQAAVLGSDPPKTATAAGEGAGGRLETLSPYQQSVAKAVQSIGQTTAIVIQDAADMLRNISTTETTAIGVATAAWIATKKPEYKDIIETSMKVINDAADAYLKIGSNAYAVLNQFKG